MKVLLISVSLLLVLTGCVQQSTKPDESEYSGYLNYGQYQLMKPVETKSGQPVYRYTSPDFRPGNYHHVLVERTVTYPKAQPTKQVSAQDIAKLETKLTQTLERSMATTLTLTDKPGKGVLRVESAITGIKISDKELAAYEYIPVAFLVASVTKQTGHRDQMVKLYLESRVTDSYTNKVVALGLREIRGQDLSDADTRLKAAHLNAGLTNAAQDIVATLKDVFTN